MAEDLRNDEARRLNISFLLAAGGILFFTGIFPVFTNGIQSLVPGWLFLLTAAAPIQLSTRACGVVPALRYAPGIPLRKTLDLNPVKRQDLFRALPGTVGVYLLLGLVTGLTVYLLRRTGLPVQEQPLLEFFRHGSPAEKAVLIFSSLILAPAGEEVCFRFAVFRKLEVHAGTVPAALLTALLFSAAHLNLQVFPALFLLSLWLTELYRRSGSLLAPMIAHILFNATTVGLLLTGAA